MRQISVSTEVFAAIWAARRSGEDSENDVLRRLLSVGDENSKSSLEVIAVRTAEKKEIAMLPVADSEFTDLRNLRRAKWWAVVRAALVNLGGSAQLYEIYKEVKNICKLVERDMPDSLEATIRGTLEDNSSDSERYKEVRDVFFMPRGKHAGYWALRHPR